LKHIEFLAHLQERALFIKNKKERHQK